MDRRTPTGQATTIPHCKPATSIAELCKSFWEARVAVNAAARSKAVTQREIDMMFDRSEELLTEICAFPVTSTQDLIEKQEFFIRSTLEEESCEISTQEILSTPVQKLGLPICVAVAVHNDLKRLSGS